MDKKAHLGFLGFLFSTLVIFGGCSNSKSNDKPSSKAKAVSFYKIGHRGTRGLMPENTIPAMKKGLDEGANTIEFDVYATKDNKVVVYHDASINPSFTSLPGTEVTKENRREYLLYKMSYNQIRAFKIGKNENDYPGQKEITASIPLVSTLLDSVEAYTSRKDMSEPSYLLEIKSAPSFDGEEQPAPKEYIEIIMNALGPRLQTLGNRLIIQSFDKRPLQVIHEAYPRVQLGYLVGNQELNLQNDVDALGFTPEFYNPYYKRVTPQLIEDIHAKGIKICPWTVNTRQNIKKLKEMGVDGIITDYPNYL